MRRMVLALALVVSGCAYSPPTAPTAAPLPNPNEPFAITLGTNVGTGTTADHATITAKVQGPTGVPLAGVMVTFSTTAGDLDPAQASTASNGISTTTLVASAAATVTAKAGNVSAHAGVGTQQPASPPPTPTPAPPPNPAPSPTPLPPSLVLNLPSTGTTGVAISMFVGAPSTAAPWTWTFGDGSSVQTSAFSTSHTFATAGTYTVSVTGTGASTSGKITISDAPPGPAPTPTPGPAFTVTLTATPSTVVVNTTGVTLSANVNQQFGAPPATSFAWDCGNGATFTTANASQACPGPYAPIGTATAKVTASGGGVSGSATTAITITAPPVPVITVSCTLQSPPPSNTISCNIQATLNGQPVVDTDITSVDWHWGDSSGTQNRITNVANHTYGVAGTFSIIVNNIVVTGTTAKGSGQTSITVH